jgi:type IV secretion system protein VirD4
MDSVGSYYGLHLMAFIRAAYLGAGPLWIGADEFTNAPTKKLVRALTTLRAYGVSVSMIAQSRSEVERKLGKNELLTVEENAIVKQWFGFSSFEEAERVSKAIGEEHAVASSLSGDNENFKLQTSLSLVKQAHFSPSQLMAMPRGQQLLHLKGVGFYLAHTISQANIAPYCDLLADNPLEGGRLPSDPWIRLTLPAETKK